MPKRKEELLDLFHYIIPTDTHEILHLKTKSSVLNSLEYLMRVDITSFLHRMAAFMSFIF